MPLAETSIIAPGTVSSRAPLKKSTVGWMVFAVLILAAIGVIAPRMMVSSEKSTSPPDKQAKAPETGKSSTINDELEQAERKLARERAARAAEVEAERRKRPAETAPLPGEGLGDNRGLSGDRPSKASPVDLRVGSGSRTDGIDVLVQEDAAVRQSKSVAFDSGESGVQGSVASAAAAIPGLTGIRAPGSAPAAGAEPAADAGGPNRAAIQALIDSQRRPEGLPAPGVGADRAWLKEFADRPSSNAPLKPYAIASRYTLVQGKVIPAVLGRNLNTDLPGEVTACSTIDVYDSITSDHLLIPKGSCFSGQYSNSVRPGQERVMFAFSRIVLPNGTSVDLPGSTGADLGGAAGIEGDVNNHFFKMFTNSFLVAWLADRAEGGSGPSTTIGSSGGAQSAAGQVLVDVSRSILERNKFIPPTITVPKGTRINVEVTKDMEFPGPYRNR